MHRYRKPGSGSFLPALPGLVTCILLLLTIMIVPAFGEEAEDSTDNVSDVYTNQSGTTSEEVYSSDENDSSYTETLPDESEYVEETVDTEENAYTEETTSYPEELSDGEDGTYTENSENSDYTEDSSYNYTVYEDDSLYSYEDSDTQTDDSGTDQTEKSEDTDASSSDTENAQETRKPTDYGEGWPSGPEISSSAAVVMEASTGIVLYSQNMHEAHLPSSSVKIMTCLVALENSNLTDEVVITATGTAGVTDGGAHISAQIGEIFTMEQCLYAIMLASANDAALQVAEQVGGTVEQFVQMMNDRVRSIGCLNTWFSNPTGLYDTGQESTAYDQALILAEAMKNDTFRKICSTFTYTIPATNLSGGSRVLTNKFPLADPTNECYYSACIGGKEGYTSESGSVLSCEADNRDLRLICSIMNGEEGNTPYDAISLLDFGFTEFRLVNLGKEDFSVISGGKVVIPVDADAAAVTYKENPRGDGNLDRTYYFGDIVVGDAVAQVPVVQDDSVYLDGRKNMEEAQAFSEKHSKVPYYLFGIGGTAIVCFLAYLLIRRLWH